MRAPKYRSDGGDLIKFPLREGSKGGSSLEYPTLDHTRPKWIFQFRMGVLGKTWDQEGVFYLRKMMELIFLGVPGSRGELQDFQNTGGLARDWDPPAKPVSPSWKWEQVLSEKYVYYRCAKSFGGYPQQGLRANVSVSRDLLSEFQQVFWDVPWLLCNALKSFNFFLMEK